LKGLLGHGATQDETLSHRHDAHRQCVAVVTSAGRRSKNIKVALALSRDVPGIDFINGMYEVFKSDVEARTTSALTVEIIYGGVLPVSRMNQMRTGAIQMSDLTEVGKIRVLS